MSDNTEIGWTDATFNPWWGCQRVSPGCQHCYAESFAKRVGQKVWGVEAPRRFFAEKHWQEPRKWNAEAKKLGVRKRVFCSSMADVFEDRRDLDPEREKLWKLIEETEWTDWQLLTKRPENVLRLAPERWKKGFPTNVWMGTTTENQEYANLRIPHLLLIPAAVRFISAEPLLGPIDLESVPLPHDDEPAAWCETCKRPRAAEWLDSVPLCVSCGEQMPSMPTWVISGGESGPGARPSEVEWYRALQQQCYDYEIPFFMKQMGRCPLVREAHVEGLHGDALREAAEAPFREWPDGTHFGNPLFKERKDLNGRVVMLREPKKKGSDMNEWPESFRVQEFPETTKPAFADSSGS